MKNKRRWLHIWLTILGCLAFSPICKGDDSESLKWLAEALRNHKIGGIDILAMSPETHRVAGMTVDQLESDFDYKVQIRGNVVFNQTSLANVLENTVIRDSVHGDDLRWGLIFYDRKAKRVASIYLDYSGRRGTIGSKKVTYSAPSFDASLIHWLNENFPFK